MVLELYPHQSKALAYLKAEDGFALFHDMGTGKTLTTVLDLIPRLDDGRSTRALIICPLSVIPSWLKEVDTHSVYQATACRGTKLNRKLAISGDSKIVVINYDLLHSHLPELLAANFDYIVADESQRLIGSKSRWTKAALKLAAQASVRRILTGTPIRKFSLDLYNQMRFINPNILPWRSHFAFRKQFAIEVPRGGFTEIIGVRNEEDIHIRCAPFVDYVTFDDAIKGMPDWIDAQHIVPMVPEQARVYKELKRDLLTRINGSEITAQNAAVEMGRLSQVSGGTIKDPDGKTAHILGSKKMQELKDIAEATTGQIVVWAKYRAELEWIAEELGVPFIHGGVSGTARHEILTDFRLRKHRIVICQLDSLSEGVNELSNADLEVRWSYDWKYTGFVQSRARMRRSGRTNPRPCRSIQLITEGSTDEKVIAAVMMKEGVAVGTLEAIRSVLK